MITHAEQIITHTIYCGHQNLSFFQKCFIWYWVINEETKSPLQAAPVDIDKSLSSHQRENYINNASMGMKTVEWKISTWMIQRRSFGENLEKVVEDIQQLFQLGCASIQHLKVFNLLCESPPAVVKEHKPFHLTFMFTPKNKTQAKTLKEANDEKCKILCGIILRTHQNFILNAFSCDLALSVDLWSKIVKCDIRGCRRH